MNSSTHIGGKFIRAILQRPAVVALIFLIAGIMTHRWFPGFFLLAAFLVVGILAVLLHLIPLPSILRWISVGLLILLLGAWRAQQATPPLDDPLLDYYVNQPLPIVVEATVTRDPLEYPRGTNVLLDDVTVASDEQYIPIEGKVSLRLDAPQTSLKYGDRVQVWGYLYHPDPKRNPGGTDWASVYRRMGVVAKLKPQMDYFVKVVGNGNKSWLATEFIYPLRSRIIRQIHQWFSPETQPTVAALLVGEREELDPDYVEATRRSGVAHLLVISGFHVGVIALFLLGVFSIFRIPYSVKIILAFIGIALFAMIAEYRPPVLRAMIMALILGGSYLFQRRWDPWNTLAAAAFIILLIRPGDLLDPGFQLSFAAVASIMFFYPAFHWLLMQYRIVHLWRRIPFFGRSSYAILLVTISAQIGILPIVAAQFGRIPTLGILATSFGAPLIILIVPFSLIAVILGAIGIPQAQWLALSVDQLVLLFQNLTQFVSSISFSSLQVSSVSYVMIAGLFLLGYMLWHFKQRWARWGMAVSVVLLMNAAVWSGDESELNARLEVAVLDVGQGTSVVIRFSDGRSLVVDGGPAREDWDTGERVVIPCLECYGIDTLDAIIATHDDNDHLGGLISVIERFPVRNVYWNGIRGDSETFRRFEDALDRHQLPLTTLRAGQLLPGFETVPIWIISPDREVLDKLVSGNDASLVLQIRINQVNILLPGDIETLTEGQLLRYGDLLKSDVLLVPHHGSASSNSLPFLKAVSPQFAVISAGRRNPHGHPSPAVLDRLESLYCQIERTDQDGAVVLRTDGHRFWKYDGWR